MNNNLRTKYIKALSKFQEDKYPFSINELMNIDWIKTEGDNIMCVRGLINSDTRPRITASKQFDFVIKYDDDIENIGLYNNVYVISVYLDSDNIISDEISAKVHQRNPLNHNCFIIKHMELRKICYNKRFLKESYVTKIKI